MRQEMEERLDIDPAVTSALLFGTVNGLSADDLADALVTTAFSGLRTARR